MRRRLATAHGHRRHWNEAAKANVLGPDFEAVFERVVGMSRWTDSLPTFANDCSPGHTRLARIYSTDLYFTYVFYSMDVRPLA